MKEKTNFERKLILICEKYANVILIVFALVMAILIQKTGCLREPYGDWTGHFSFWFEEMKTKGLSNYVGGYPKGMELIFWFLIKINADSLVGLKCFVWFFDLIIAVSTYFFVKGICKNKMKASLAFAVTLLLPSLVLNTSIFGQVDAIYVGLIVLGLLMWQIGETHNFIVGYYLSGIFVGMSFGIKQTAILFLPMIAYFYIKEKKFNILHLAMIPLGYILLSAPKWIASGNAYEAFLSPYFEDEYNVTSGVIVSNFTNIYSLFPQGPSWSSWLSDSGMSAVGNLFCLALLGIIFLIVIKIKKPQVDKIILIEIVFSVIICCTKPGIHDRYMLIADVLSVIYCFISKDKYRWVIAGVINFVSFYNIMNYLHGCVEEISNTRIILIEIVSLIFVCFTFWLVKHLLGELKSGRTD